MLISVYTLSIAEARYAQATAPLKLSSDGPDLVSRPINGSVDLLLCYAKRYTQFYHGRKVYLSGENRHNDRDFLHWSRRRPHLTHQLYIRLCDTVLADPAFTMYDGCVRVCLNRTLNFDAGCFWTTKYPFPPPPPPPPHPHHGQILCR